jgi:4-hydroxy-3-polyprenylbenzoate decarboxylase
VITPPAEKTQVRKDITNLRSALAWLAAQGDLLTTDVEVDPDLEITGIQKHLDGGPVLLFNNVKGKPHARAITNLFSDIAVVDKLFGYESPTARTRKLAHALTHPLARKRSSPTISTSTSTSRPSATRSWRPS